MKREIEYAKEIEEMYSDIKYIMRKTCAVSELPERTQQEIYLKILEVWHILYHNQNLISEG